MRIAIDVDKLPAGCVTCPAFIYIYIYTMSSIYTFIYIRLQFVMDYMTSFSL